MNVKYVRTQRVLKTQGARQNTEPQFLESVSDNLLKPLPKLTQGINSSNEFPKSRQLKRDKRRHSMKIIPYPVNHYNCWVTSNYYSTKKTIFANKLISNLVVNSKEQTIKSGRETQEKCKTIRLSTDETRRSPQRSECRKYAIGQENKKISNILLEYKGVEIKSLKPLLKRMKQNAGK